MTIPAPAAITSILAVFIDGRSGAATDHRHEYSQYLAERMRPAIHALMLVAAFGYLAAATVSALAAASSVPLWLRLAPALPLLLIAGATKRVRRPLALSLLTLACVLVLEIGSNLNAIGRMQGLPWVMPGVLLVPVASAAIWLARWDFIGGMALCAIGPLPMLLYDRAYGEQILPYLVYMIIAIALSAVLRAFMTRTLFDQFQLEQKLREQANTDGLTGLLLRNRFLELARAALFAGRREQQPMGLLYVDADHFKQLNDQHGHAAGDVALIALAGALRARLREGDLIGRIGGEEFAMLLPGLDLAQAGQRAEQLRLAVRAIRCPGGSLSVSIGVAACRADGETIETLLARADKALRQAKREGRDRVVLA